MSAAAFSPRCTKHKSLNILVTGHQCNTSDTEWYWSLTVFVWYWSTHDASNDSRKVSPDSCIPLSRWISINTWRYRKIHYCNWSRFKFLHPFQRTIVATHKGTLYLGVAFHCLKYSKQNNLVRRRQKAYVCTICPVFCRFWRWKSKISGRSDGFSSKSPLKVSNPWVNIGHKSAPNEKKSYVFPTNSTFSQRILCIFIFVVGYADSCKGIPSVSIDESIPNVFTMTRR
jgi:hypothetical protein